jgi:hypothetical protein
MQGGFLARPRHGELGGMQAGGAAECGMSWSGRWSGCNHQNSQICLKEPTKIGSSPGARGLRRQSKAEAQGNGKAKVMHKCCHPRSQPKLLQDSGKQATRGRTKEGPDDAAGHCNTAPLSLAKQSEK